VDSTAGCELLSFLDCYSGYHQIALAVDDQEKTSFITLVGAYCYNTMSFGLKTLELLTSVLYKAVWVISFPILPKLTSTTWW
jgi:hypothetical protein